MTIKSRTGCTIIALLFCGAAPALAQTTPPEHVPLQKTIGQAGPEVVPSLIVMNARGASLQTDTHRSGAQLDRFRRPPRAGGRAFAHD